MDSINQIKNLLKTKNLAIGYFLKKGKKTILHRGINVNLKQGELTCLIGPNGSGKSTLIRTLTNFQKPLEGEVFLENNRLEKYSSLEISRKISVVLTEKTDVGALSVFSLVALGRSPYTGFLGKLTTEDKIIVEGALSDAGILNLHNSFFNELSDGEKQKVMLAKSIAQDTPVIILDEPTAFLDFPAKIDIMLLLKNFAENFDKTVLLSTHDLNLAIQFSDKLWMLGKNIPLIQGAPEDLILKGEFNRYFDRKKTSFDKQTGQFVIGNIPGESLQVSGSGLYYQWLIRALERKGYSVNKQPGSKFSIEVTNSIEKPYKIIKDRLVEELSNIENVLYFLNSKTNKC